MEHTGTHGILRAKRGPLGRLELMPHQSCRASLPIQVASATATHHFLTASPVTDARLTPRYSAACSGRPFSAPPPDWAWGFSRSTDPAMLAAFLRGLAAAWEASSPASSAPALILRGGGSSACG